MSIILKKINNEVVKPIKIKIEGADKPIKGYDLIPELYANIFLCAKKKSGKTVVLFNLIKKCIDKKTKVVIYCSTLYKDKSYKAIREYLDKNNITWEGHTSLTEDGVDKLEELVQRLQNEGKNEDEEPKDKKGKKESIILFNDSDDESEDEVKSKFRVPEYLIILDDISNELKNSSLVSLLKKNRHFHSKILIASQYFNDLKPESRKQMDNIMIFRSMPEGKLKELWHDCDLSVDFETFVKLYKFATKEPYGFLNIDLNNDTYRRCFNFKFELKKGI